jgi:hypothetical protein
VKSAPSFRSPAYGTTTRLFSNAICARVHIVADPQGMCELLLLSTGNSRPLAMSPLIVVGNFAHTLFICLSIHLYINISVSLFISPLKWKLQNYLVNAHTLSLSLSSSLSQPRPCHTLMCAHRPAATLFRVMPRPRSVSAAALVLTVPLLALSEADL